MFSYCNDILYVFMICILEVRPLQDGSATHLRVRNKQAINLHESRTSCLFL